VSVVIPCFNLGEFVEEAVQSVLAQTFVDFEIVVVDDGSTDADTRRRVDGLASQPKTAVLHTANQGLSAARNLGIARSHGAYVCSLDADDRLRPMWLERAVALLDENPDIAFASHWVEAFGDRSFLWQPVRCDLTALLDCNVVNGAALLRRSVFDAVGGFDESMREGCEDWEFWIRVTSNGYTGAIIPEVLYDYRQRHDSMSREMHAVGAQPRLYATLVEKHRAVFERYLLDLMLRRDWAFGDVCRRIDDLGVEIETLLEPALFERRQELAAAHAQLATLESRHQAEQPLSEQRLAIERVEALERQVAELRAEAMALRDSWSWQITRPLRRLYELAGLGRRAADDR
jgi:glycosyltransferase involved in cell wall biosynthesis